MNLLPIKIEKGSRIFQEEQEVDELTFVCKGSFAIGFVINRYEKLVIKQSRGTVVAGFECSIDRRSLYLYKSLSVIEGYFIRKKNWKELGEQFPDYMKDVNNHFLSIVFAIQNPFIQKCKQKEI